MCFRIATNQKAVVLGKRKDASFVWTGCDFQVDLHCKGLTFDREIVKRNFVNVAGVESDATALEVFTVVDAGQILPIRVKPQVAAFDSDLQFVRSAAGFDGV